MNRRRAMRFISATTFVKTAILLTAVLLLGAGLAVAQQQVNLTAAPTTVTLPDGTVVPMWGYFCGAAAGTTTTATCAALNPYSVGNPTATPPVPATWSPVVITVPYVSTGTSLTINLTNHLSFTPAAGGAANNIPTSTVIAGQGGGGLGASPTTTPSPSHADVQGCP